MLATMLMLGSADDSVNNNNNKVIATVKNDEVSITILTRNIYVFAVQPNN